MADICGRQARKRQPPKQPSDSSSRHNHSTTSQAFSSCRAEAKIKDGIKSQISVTGPAFGRARTGSEVPQGQQTWQKVLWKKQLFPDNYTDGSFLQHLVVNADVPERDFWTVVLGSAAVSQQLASVVAAVSVPVHLRLGLMSGTTLLLMNVLMLLIGYAVCGLLGKHVLGGSLLRGIRQVALLSGGVYLMSPMLHSLTRNISEDSVIAMIVGLSVTHLSLHDYNFVNSVTEQLTGTLSLGAAVFAAVLFASTLPSEFEVFVHILFCLQVYLLSPFVRRYVRSASLTAHILLTGGMTAAALLLLLPLSGILSLLYLLVIFSVSFVCPYWLVHIQKFKAKINGPWDEAVPRIPTSIHSRSGGAAGGLDQEGSRGPVSPEV